MPETRIMFHVTGSKTRGGTVETGRVSVAAQPMGSAARERTAAIQAAAFKYDWPTANVSAVRIMPASPVNG